MFDALMPSAEPYLPLNSIHVTVSRTWRAASSVISACAHSGETVSTARGEGVLLYFTVRLHRDPWRGCIDVDTGASHPRCF